MKKILLIITLCLFPLFTYADECTKEQINQYKKEIENIKIDINYEKKAKNNYGDDSEKGNDRLKGVYEISVENIPSGFQVLVDTGYSVLYFNNSTTKIGSVPGSIYRVKYINDSCKESILKQYSIYVPEYNPIKNGKVWNDVSLFKPEISNSTSKINMSLIVLLILIITILSIIVFIIIKNKKGALNSEK